MSKSFRRFLARNRRKPLVAAAIRRAESWIRGADNFDYDLIHNGEMFLLRVAAQHLSPRAILFDVGANEGSWSRLARTYFPDAKIHAFEPIPATFERLAGTNLNIQLNACGLGADNGPRRFRISDDNTRATLIANPDVATREELECPIIRGDVYCAEQGLDQIDILKIDTEGAEHLVLKGFSRMLEAGRIGVIQFEYGRANVTTRFLLADFHSLLESFGFKLGKLYPNYVAFSPYATTMENFLGPNYVAVHERLQGLRHALSG